MDKQLFRKASVDRVSSPEQLNDYIRVSNPGIWMVLAAIIILLVGVCVWGIFGRIDTTLDTAGVCENGTLVCYIRETEKDTVRTGLPIIVNGESYSVSEVSEKPIKITDETDSYLSYLGDFMDGEWVYCVTADTSLSDGAYKAEIITESISPMSFVLN